MPLLDEDKPPLGILTTEYEPLQSLGTTANI